MGFPVKSKSVAMHKNQTSKSGSSTVQKDFKDGDMDFRKILKDVEYLGSSNMTWKERKQLEDRRVVALGGKPTKKQRIPLSVARCCMKKRKEREQKLLQEGMVLGRFGGKLQSSTTRVAEKRGPEDRVLKSSEGNFRNGVLNVRHMLRGSSSRENDDKTTEINKGKKRKGAGKKKGGKKQSGKKRR
ncbi:uncharacterized protein LOC122641584 [Telopea speciosissima]|uniref:uncharacterized protein LOC122641584 n=1 Tax=Telopea speciosissima TaxID=54955 RepID=UPI001CC3A0A5|nr:uncharacterized protein LOC122641584 [Telopea speciosissima]